MKRFLCSIVLCFSLAVVYGCTDSDHISGAGVEQSTPAVVSDRPEEGSRSSEPTPAAVLPRLVDLGADRCIPCKKMAPILEALREEYKGVVSVEIIDIWKDPDAGKEYGIRVIPTQIFYNASGQEVYRHEGFLGREAILKKFAEMEVAVSPRNAPEAE